jgi:hypothetical protein
VVSPGWALVLGILGAVGAEFVMYVFPTRFDESPPRFLSRRYYWVVMGVAALIAGSLAYAAAQDLPIRWYVALNIGITWPLILRQGWRRTDEPQATNVD